jgi:hypothetical protein
MNEHQKRIWQSMIDLIQSYLKGQTNDFYNLVGKLELALDASEIKDESLINKWYDFWVPLETRRAVEGNAIDKEKATDELLSMKNFLVDTFVKVSKGTKG